MACYPGIDLTFGPAFWGLLPGLLIVTLVGAMDTLGDAIAVQRACWRKPCAIDFRSIQGAINADGLGNLLSGILGTVPKRVRRITIDLDPTDDPTHGGQQLTFFNRFYDTWCYLPLAGFLTFDEAVEQYLFCYVLRPGNAAAKHGCIGILKRLLPRLRRAFPGARLRIRLDGGFSGPELYEFFEAEKLDYVVGMAQNPVLLSLAEPLMAEVRADFEALRQTTHRYTDCAYRARNWPHERRVVIKAEVAAHFGRKPKDNPRSLVTNLKATPRHIYEAVYCARGDAENRLKEVGLKVYSFEQFVNCHPVVSSHALQYS